MTDRVLLRFFLYHHSLRLGNRLKEREKKGEILTSAQQRATLHPIMLLKKGGGEKEEKE